MSFKREKESRGKKLLVGGVAGTVINGICWFIYTNAGNIASSIGLTFAICVAIGITLSMMSKRKLK